MELLIHGRNLVTSLTDKKILKEVQIINYVGLLQNASKSGTKQIWNTQVIVIQNMSHRAHMKSVDPNWFLAVHSYPVAVQLLFLIVLPSG